MAHGAPITQLAHKDIGVRELRDALRTIELRLRDVERVIASGYSVTNLTGLETRTLDATAATAAQVRQCLATLINDALTRHALGP